MNKRLIWLWRGVLVGIIGLLASTAGRAQAWQTAVAVGQATSDNSGVSAVATDGAGNVYLAGSFTGSVTLGASTLVSAAGYDSFLAKWSPGTNTFVWAQQIGGLNSEDIRALALEGTTVTVAGTFNSASMSIGNTVLTNASTTGSDAFVARYSDAGTLAWALRMGGVGHDYINRQGLVVRGGNAYVAGGFNQTAVFGPVTLTAAGNTDMFVAKIDNSGNVQWAQRGGGSSFDDAQALVLSGTTLYVQGNTQSTTTDFGGLNASGQGGVILARLHDGGATASFDWAVRTGNGTSVAGLSLAASGSNLYLAGHYSGSAVTFGNSTLPAPQRQDAFVARFTDTGSTATAAWAQSNSGNDQESATAVACDGGNVYLTGWFTSPTLGFGSLSLNNSGPIGTMNLFVLKLTDVGSSGRVDWLQQGGGVGEDAAYALAVRGGQVWVGGWAGTSARFGNLQLNIPSNGQVAFVAQLADQTLATKAATAAGLALFPNPARTNVRVRVPAGATAVLVLDLAGRTVRAVPTSVGESEALVSLRGLAPGSYLLRAGAATGRLQID